METIRYTRLEHIALLRARDGDACYLCDKEFTDDLSPTIDHVWPQSKGGSWELENLRLACRPCNLDKGDRVFVDGILEPKAYRESYRDRKINRQATLDSFCELCYDGRLLLEDEACPECDRGPVAWSWHYKLEPKDCPHSGRFWCWMDSCGLVDREPAIIDVLNGDVDFVE